MKLLCDTNILVSANKFPNGVCMKAYKKALLSFSVVVCDYSILELRRVYKNKFPSDIGIFEKFLEDLTTQIAVIQTPPESESVPEEMLVRDADDRPILRAAINANVDIIVTGDKDLLESNLAKPRIISPVEFVNHC